MRRFALATGVAGLSVMAVLVFAAPGPKGAEAVEAAWARGMKAGNAAAVAACYAPDAMLWMPGGPEVRGAESIREVYVQMLEANTVTDVALDDVHHLTNGDLSAGWGRFRMTLAPKAGGQPVTMIGRFTDVVQRRGGRWLIVADHASLDPPIKMHR